MSYWRTYKFSPLVLALVLTLSACSDSDKGPSTADVQLAIENSIIQNGTNPHVFDVHDVEVLGCEADDNDSSYICDIELDISKNLGFGERETETFTGTERFIRSGNSWLID